MRLLLRSASLLAFASLALAASAQLGPNLVKDGDFESATLRANGLSYNPGETFDGGNWYAATVPTVGFSYVGPYSNPNYVISGTKSLTLQEAAIQQTLSTVPGTTYRLTFDARVVERYTTLTVRLGDAFGFVLVPYNPINPYHLSALLTPSTSTSLLSIEYSGGPSLNLDNISVQATPEPGTWAALGLGAVAFARRRRR